MELPLDPPVVVIVDVVVYGCNKLFPVCELPSVVCLSLEDSPESFHRAIVDAVCHSGHAVEASVLLHQAEELLACVLESTVTVAEGMSIRLCIKRIPESLHHDRIVVAVAYPVCDYAPVIEIEDCAEVYLVHISIIVILEFRDICEPFLIGFRGCEFPVEYVVGNMGCIPSTSRAAQGLPLYR